MVPRGEVGAGAECGAGAEGAVEVGDDGNQAGPVNIFTKRRWRRRVIHVLKLELNIALLADISAQHGGGGGQASPMKKIK